MESFKFTFLKSYSVTKRREALKKIEFLAPCQIVIAEELGKLQELVNEALHHALVNHSLVMTNTIHNVVINTL